MSAQMYGFVLLPDQTNLRKMVEINNSVFPASPLQLDKEYTLPHCTVLQAPIRNTFDYQSSLEKFVGFSGFKHEPRTEIGTMYQDGYAVLIDVDNARWLSDFNAYMVREVSEFIDVPPVGKDTVFENSDQELSYSLTGYKRNLAAYSPHFTIAVNEGKDKASFDPSANTALGATVRFRKLAFCKHGQYGKVAQVISSVDLPFQWD